MKHARTLRAPYTPYIGRVGELVRLRRPAAYMLRAAKIMMNKLCSVSCHSDRRSSLRLQSNVCPGYGSSTTIEPPPSIQRLLRLLKFHTATAAMRSKRRKQDMEDYCQQVLACSRQHDLPCRRQDNPGPEPIRTARLRGPVLWKNTAPSGPK